VATASLITRDDLRRRLGTIRTAQLFFFPGGLLVGALVPLAGWAARSIMGSAFPESLVVPLLGTSVAIMLVSGVVAGLGTPLIVRALAPRCPSCGALLVDGTARPDVAADGSCRHCGAQVMALEPRASESQASGADIATHLQAYLTNAPSHRTWLWSLVFAVTVVAPLLALAFSRLPLVVLCAPLVAWIVSAYFRHRRDPHRRSLRCPVCGEDLLSLRNAVSDARHILATGACPTCAARLFAAPARIGIEEE